LPAAPLPSITPGAGAIVAAAAPETALAPRAAVRPDPRGE
jgi:hypothetical protein